MGADMKSKSYLLRTLFSQPKSLIFGLVLTLLQSQIAVAEAAIVVVVRKDSPLLQLSRDEVVALFLGKTRRSNDIPLTPFDSKDNELRDRFYLEVADMSGMRVKAYWSRIVFSGQGRPPVEVSVSEARTKLADESDALIYLPADQVAPDMKVVFSMPQVMLPKH
jgi:hypothetical protein